MPKYPYKACPECGIKMDRVSIRITNKKYQAVGYGCIPCGKIYPDLEFKRKPAEPTYRI